MQEMKELLEIGFAFHGHRCPAMPLGLRAGQVAMKVLGVERSKDKELMVRSETGKGHAAGCFLDGIMTATGCTYGKSNIEKRYYNKMAFTLVEAATGRSVRVSLKPEFFEKTLKSPFVQKRREGVPPQDIPAEVADSVIAKALTVPEEDFLDIGEIKEEKVTGKRGVFEARRCESCGELTFINKLRVSPEGKLVCMPCAGEYD